MLHEFSYLAPRNRKELLGILSSEGPRAKILAGGTDLLVNVRAGILRPAVILDLKKIAENHEIRWSDHEGLSIGPAVTINALIENGCWARFPPGFGAGLASTRPSPARNHRQSRDASPAPTWRRPSVPGGAWSWPRKNGTREIA